MVVLVEVVVRVESVVSVFLTGTLVGGTPPPAVEQPVS